MPDETQSPIEHLVDAPDLAGALESDRFKHFLDHIPIAIAVSELQPAEHIVYVNLEFERITGRTCAEVEGRPWSFLPGEGADSDDHRRLGEAVAREQDHLGVFTIERDGEPARVEVWSNVICDSSGEPAFRLIALADAGRCPHSEELARRVAEKDVLLRELQHRVRNNLQMITALIRLEARNVRETEGARFERLAGRIEALSLLYDRMDQADSGQSIDLGVYLSQIAASVMAAHAVEGVHLDLAVDTCLVSVNVAMPTGLAVNELMTNALKHAFAGREAGTIRLECASDGETCTVRVSDDGIGLPDGVIWPQRGKMGAMIVHALEQNANARVGVESGAGQGVSVTLRFSAQARGG